MWGVSVSLFSSQVVLENCCRMDDHDMPFVQASIFLTNMLCEILNVGELRTSLQFTQHSTELSPHTHLLQLRTLLHQDKKMLKKESLIYIH